MTDPWRTPPTLADEHVTLRPLSRGDRPALLEAFADGFDHSFADQADRGDVHSVPAHEWPGVRRRFDRLLASHGNKP